MTETFPVWVSARAETFAQKPHLDDLSSVAWLRICHRVGQVREQKSLQVGAKRAEIFVRKGLCFGFALDQISQERLHEARFIAIALSQVTQQ